MSRAETSESTFADAKKLADANGLGLTNPSDGCYQLRHSEKGWIINMYPRRNGMRPRMYRDRNHRGPFLDLPDPWTIVDAVKAAIDAETK